jgi:magnesium-transporting ATPase (P-type)
MMSVLVRGEGRGLVMVKGAPEAVLARCSSVLANNGEGAVPLSPGLANHILADMQVTRGVASCMMLVDERSCHSSDHAGQAGQAADGTVIAHQQQQAGVWQDAICMCGHERTQSLCVVFWAQVFGSGQALRCLALAFRSMPANADTVTPADEQGLTFIGLVGAQGWGGCSMLHFHA